MGAPAFVVRPVDTCHTIGWLAVDAPSPGQALTSAMLALVSDGPTSFFGILSVIGLALSALLSIWLVWGVIRSGRL